VPITHAQVTDEDTMLELGVKVLGNTASAILQARDQLNRETMDRAIDLLTAAERLEFYALGHDGVVANDAQFKFLRFGVPSMAVTDPRMQPLAANVSTTCSRWPTGRTHAAPGWWRSPRASRRWRRRPT
jgi:glucokinase